jgi:hypothetical protein
MQINRRQKMDYEYLAKQEVTAEQKRAVKRWAKENATNISIEIRSLIQEEINREKRKVSRSKAS